MPRVYQPDYIRLLPTYQLLICLGPQRTQSHTFPSTAPGNRSKIPIWAVDIVHKIGMILRPTPVAAKNDPWMFGQDFYIIVSWTREKKHAKTVSKNNLKLMPANRMNHSVLHWMFMLTTQSPKLTRHQVHYNYAQHHVSEDKNQWACNGTSANRQPFRASRTVWS